MANSHLDQFIQFEKRLGITQKNFEDKYLFPSLRNKLMQLSSQSNEVITQLLDQPHVNLYLSFGSVIQADIDGFTKEQQTLFHFYGASIISDACQFLQLPITTCVSAQTILHRFYTKSSFLKFDIRDVALGAVFLAGKAQETIRKPRDIAYVFDQIFKFQNIKKVTKEMERQILKQLGFELYQITWNEQPHRLMYFYINLFKSNPNNQQTMQQQIQFQNFTRKAFNYLNDSYRTDLCLFLPFQMIVASCIYLAFRKEKMEVPRTPWWTIMETSYENLMLGGGKIQNIYNQFSKKMPKFEDCKKILDLIAQKNNNQERFPVKYMEENYSLISLQQINNNQEISMIENNKKLQNIQYLQQQQFNIMKQQQNIMYSYQQPFQQNQISQQQSQQSNLQTLLSQPINYYNQSQMFAQQQQIQQQQTQQQQNNQQNFNVSSKSQQIINKDRSQSQHREREQFSQRKRSYSHHKKSKSRKRSYSRDRKKRNKESRRSQEKKNIERKAQKEIETDLIIEIKIQIKKIIIKIITFNIKMIIKITMIINTKIVETEKIKKEVQVDTIKIKNITKINVVIQKKDTKIEKVKKIIKKKKR
ncbi:n-terminal domain protein [Ichthyophthirius multifiliis]|uniref:N-terminal domain protein n=1 Tax=Ichthyophthirius multifiliis TaxID=5932 RepID=G0R289_ICHMU|nr:n-terminal domain protein [Ichthyophthirius multifiliis]EGR28414.1 n-terminal domain protein [Ichthyophthirius multifiliis]|eukprot:XP_004029650.1 n-terminal domain protein [Ichthyophthirius multifiliis]